MVQCMQVPNGVFIYRACHCNAYHGGPDISRATSAVILAVKNVFSVVMAFNGPLMNSMHFKAIRCTVKL